MPEMIEKVTGMAAGRMNIHADRLIMTSISMSTTRMLVPSRCILYLIGVEFGVDVRAWYYWYLDVTVGLR